MGGSEETVSELGRYDAVGNATGLFLKVQNMYKYNAYDTFNNVTW